MTQPAAGESGRALNPCHGCGAEDDHPRHHIINSFTDESQNSVRHLDCCVADGGCPDHCEPMLASADGKHGLELAAHLQTLPSGTEG